MEANDTFTLIFGKGRSSTIGLNLIAARIRNKLKFIFIWEWVGIVIGLIICFSIPKEYVSKVKMIPETQPIQSFNIFDLASSVNIFDLNDDAYPYTLYPLVLRSTYFLSELLPVTVPISDNGETKLFTVRDLLSKEYRYPWWCIQKYFGDFLDGKESSYNYAELDYKLIERLKKDISIFVMSKTSNLELEVKMQDPLAAAVLADTIAERLERFIYSYRYDKESKQYEFVEKMFNESKQKYEEQNLRYAQYLDSNQYITRNLDKIILNRLKVDMEISENDYRNNSTIFLSEKLNRSAHNPVLYILEPATVAVKASYPRKLVILSYCTFFFALIPMMKVIFERR